MTALVDNAAQSRYELPLAGGTVFASYRKSGAIVQILHVEAPPALRGTGAAGRLMQLMMERFAAQNLRAFPVCGYAVSWLRRHPEHGARVAAGPAE